MAEGSALATCRMYEGWKPLRDGYTKNLWSATGTAMGAVVMVAMLLLFYVVPVVGLVVGLAMRSPTLMALGTAGYGVGVVGRVVSARTTGGALKDAVFHPVSILMLCGLIVRSWRAHRRGTIVWKGRFL